jgi:FlaA1/EpsC-like NDP-sugar epimerase
MKKKFFKDKKILISGATGSVGTSLIKELIENHDFKVIRAMSNDENGLFSLKSIIRKNLSTYADMTKNDGFYKKEKIRLLHGDVRSLKRCIESTRDIDIVIHAAAMKHVDICEYNPDETVATNILGTRNMVKASLKNKVEKFIFISTDKAVDPSTLMGKSKLAAETIVTKANKKNSKNTFHVIRFGNVIGSRGSVLEVFNKQIKANLSLTITHRNMTRFFMNLDVAAKKILKSIEVSRGGEIFAIQSMESFKIDDLAKALIKYHSKGKKNRSKVSYIGVRKNEKLQEKLLSDKEADNVVQTKDFFISNSAHNIENNMKYYNGLKLENNNLLDSSTIKLLNQKEIIKFLIKMKLVN